MMSAEIQSNIILVGFVLMVDRSCLVGLDSLESLLMWTRRAILMVEATGFYKCFCRTRRKFNNHFQWTLRNASCDLAHHLDLVADSWRWSRADQRVCCHAIAWLCHAIQQAYTVCYRPVASDAEDMIPVTLSSRSCKRESECCMSVDEVLGAYVQHDLSGLCSMSLSSMEVRGLEVQIRGYGTVISLLWNAVDAIHCCVLQASQ
jgi:hypothetical protein